MNKAFNICAVPAFTDNYIWLLSANNHAVVVDPGDAQPILAYLSEHSLELSAILITHHHNDHIGGIRQLKHHYPEAVCYGPNNPKIKGIDRTLVDGDKLSLKDIDAEFTVMYVPGHTLDHLAYVDDHHLFCGDTLFSGGCGRMFEGTPAQFHASLSMLGELPAHIKVYCAHEYTEANLAFALSIEPKNQTLQDYAEQVKQKRTHQTITLPSTIEREKAINPFLRCHTTSIQAAVFGKQSELNTSLAALTSEQKAIEAFATLRKRKDNF